MGRRSDLFMPNVAGVLLATVIFIDGIKWPQPSQAQSNRKFRCELINGVPTTVVNTVRGYIPTIRWVKSVTGQHSSVNRRCHEISARLDRFDRAGKLKFIRTGNLNSYPVLCVATGVSGNTCPMASVLITLPRQADSGKVLQQMLDLRARAAGQIIQLSGD